MKFRNYLTILLKIDFYEIILSKINIHDATF